MSNRGLIFSAMLAAYSSPAMACSPPDQVTVKTDDQFFRIAKTRIESSDAIVDGAIARSNSGEVSLKPSRIWKGAPRRSYAIANDRCGIFLPDSGQSVRVLLKRLGNNWLVIQPVTGSGKVTFNFDGIVDGYLRNVRPKNFKSVGPILPPMP
jgi:hypothetical protein